MTKPVQWNEEWDARIREAVEGLAYGTVQIIVHDGRVVQIERTERFRYEGVKDSRRTASQTPAPNDSAAQ